MKKKPQQGDCYVSLFKMLRIMRLSLLLILLSTIMTFGSASYSQNVKLTLNMNKSTVREVIKAIEDQSEFIFFYQDQNLDLNRRVNMKVSNKSVEEILKELFSETGNTYTIRDRQIIIGKAEKKVENMLLPIKEEVLPVEQQPQMKKISGSVKDEKGAPLPGVSIIVKGTTTGSITDFDGNFSFDVPVTAQTLVISFVGMKSQEITIGNQAQFNIVLQEEAVGLDEVMVVGYGTQKKETMVGAVSQVDNKVLIQAGSPNVTNAIAGKLSGILTMQQAGEPGNDDSEIIIRGLSSWNSSAPLTLVDGVERDFKGLDPKEISTISVLKDASATAVFGAKGANGVIIVTTTRGTLGKPKFDFSASYGMEKATRIPDHIDSYTTLNMLNVAFMNERRFSELISEDVLMEYKNPSSPLNALRYPNVNWFEEIVRPFAPAGNANINIRGGTNFVKYFSSLGYTYQGSYFNAYNKDYLDTRFWYNRMNYRTNLDFNLTSSTKLSFNIGGEVGIKNQPSSSIWWALYGTSPARFPAYWPAWVLEQIPDPDYPSDKGIRLSRDYAEYTGNPYTTLNNGSFNRYLDSKLFTDLFLTQDLDFITKGLSVQGKVSLSTYYQNRSLYATYNFPEYQLYFDLIGSDKNPWFREGEGNEIFKQPPVTINVGGLSGNFYSDLYYEFAFNYNRSFGSHNVSGLALANRQQKNQGTEFPYYNQGLVGRVTYDFSRKYLVEFNVGYTGSERFAPGNRYGFFPSGAFGWIVSEETFFRNAMPEWFSKFKLRYSDGLVGSDYAANRWLYISDFFKDSRGYIREDKAANTIAQWEEARKRDLGVEMGFFENSLHLGIDFFDEYREKMLLTPRSVPLLIGNLFKDLNLGELKKHGVEIEAEYRKTTERQLSYFFKGIFSFNENRIIFKDDPPYTPEYQKEAGKPLGAQNSGVILTGSGYHPTVDDIHNNLSPLALTAVNVGDYKFLDYNVDGRITNADTYPIEGSMYPPVVWSFSSGLSYKKFDFSILFQGNTGKFVEYNQSFESEFTKGNYRVHASQLDYWTPTNPGANHSTLHYIGSGYFPILGWNPVSDATGYTTYVEGRLWRKADYLKLKDVYVAYTFQPKWHKIPGLSDINVYATGNNLFMLTNLIEGDPERKDFKTGFYPQMLSARLGIKLSF